MTHEVQAVFIANSNQSVVEKFLLLIISSFLVRFHVCFGVTHLPMKEFLCYMGVVEMPQGYRNDF